MVSPAKKRKVNSDGKSVPSRGLEYFFSKQKVADNAENLSSVANENEHLTDEELARKLQAEWDSEIRGHSTQNAPKPVPTNASSSTSQAVDSTENEPSEDEQIISEPQAPQADNAKKSLTLSSVATAEDQISSSIPLDENPLTFDPSRYVQALQESWAADGGNASYALLTRCFVLVGGTQSRIKIVDTLVNCVRVLIEADPSSLLPAVWLATNAISPPYISMELGLGGSAISKALKQVCGLDNRSLKAIYDRLGDPGDVAFEAKKKQSFMLRKPKPLTIKGIYQALVKIASTQGQGSGESKQRIVDRLLQDARGGEESRYIVRTLCQHVSTTYTSVLLINLLTRCSFASEL